MSISEERSKLQIIVWIVLAMVGEAVIVLLPVACAFSGKGFIAMWGAMSEKQVFAAIRGLVYGLVVGLVVGLGLGLVYGLGLGLGLGLGSGLILGLGFRLGFGLESGLESGLGSGLGVGLGSGLLLGLSLGLSFGLAFGLGFRLVFGLVSGLVSGLSFGLAFGLGFRLVFGLVSGLGVFIGCPLGVLLIHGLRDIPEGFTTTLKGFLNPWQLENYSLKKAIASFVLVYMLVVVVFALWFNACYLEGTRENPNSYFRTGDIKNPNLWDFIYFSFVTITTLGYGDISPLHTFPQALVIVETMTGLGLIAGYLGIIVQVGGQKAQQKSRQFPRQFPLDF